MCEKLTAIVVAALAGCGRLGFGAQGGGPDGSGSSGDATVSSGLVGCWTFDEGSGTIAGDCSGNGHDATLNGGATWTIGKLGNALSFDGSSATYAMVTATSELNFGTSSFSYGLWVKLNSGGAGSGWELPLYKGGSSAAQIGYDLEFARQENTWSVNLSDGIVNRQVASPPYDYRDNTWHHVFAVVDRSVQTSSLYVDGALVAGPMSIAPLGSVTSTYNIEFSAIADPVLGSIDDARIYNRVLSASEIATLAH